MKCQINIVDQSNSIFLLSDFVVYLVKIISDTLYCNSILMPDCGGCRTMWPTPYLELVSVLAFLGVFSSLFPVTGIPHSPQGIRGNASREESGRAQEVRMTPRYLSYSLKGLRFKPFPGEKNIFFVETSCAIKMFPKPAFYDSEEKNFGCAETPVAVSAGALNFAMDDTGRRVANACIAELLDYRPDQWGYNGPGAITRALKKVCNVQEVPGMTEKKCGGFHLLPTSTFYAIPWRNWNLFFTEKSSEETMKVISKNLAVHVWNSRSHNTTVYTSSKQPYAQIARGCFLDIFHSIRFGLKKLTRECFLCVMVITMNLEEIAILSEVNVNMKLN
ncbi:uncharacterized protein GBIM_02311 [Gryllus bimaculatus]|nr:uncharacterized protein GBIM_02311 [Gryllus bimaculatus]